MQFALYKLTHCFVKYILWKNVHLLHCVVKLHVVQGLLSQRHSWFTVTRARTKYLIANHIKMFLLSLSKQTAKKMSLTLHTMCIHNTVHIFICSVCVNLFAVLHDQWVKINRFCIILWKNLLYSRLVKINSVDRMILCVWWWLMHSSD